MFTGPVGRAPAPIRGLARAMRGIATAVRIHPRVFAAVAVGVLVLQVLLPVVVLSLARKPRDFVDPAYAVASLLGGLLVIVLLPLPQGASHGAVRRPMAGT